MTKLTREAFRTAAEWDSTRSMETMRVQRRHRRFGARGALTAVFILLCSASWVAALALALELVG